MKCSKCENETRVGQRYCNACHAAYMRANRKLPEGEARMRANARSYAKVYLKRGKIIRQPCRDCGAEAQMHHPDYSKPLEVIWLCREHHLAEHHKM